MTPTPPVVTGDDTELPVPDPALEMTPDVKTPGHPTVFLEDGPTLEEPAAQ